LNERITTGGTRPVVLLPPNDSQYSHQKFTLLKATSKLSNQTKTIGEQLRKKRIDLHLSMSQLAEILELGITASAVEKWEKNQNRPTLEHLRRILEFLGFDPTLKILTGGFERSKAARMAMAAAQRRRWAKLKGTEEEVAPKKRRKMSAAGRAKIAAAAKARWAKIKAAGKNSL
jgi:transcriptional regulator with XRE-family HTH domain